MPDGTPKAAAQRKTAKYTRLAQTYVKTPTAKKETLRQPRLPFE